MDLSTLQLQLRSQHLTVNGKGHKNWEICENGSPFAVRETAIIVCDMWDRHWAKGATARVELMAPGMNEVLKRARKLGIQIIFAPSDTMDFYANSPARLRVLHAPPCPIPEPSDHDEYPLPVDDSSGGSDTVDENPVNSTVWSRQHHLLDIDEQLDAISDNGAEIYRFMQDRGIRNVLMMGVHTNMCILNRSFAIKPMVRWGFNVALVRDLTDAMYDPADPPYVSHEEGTRLIVEYIEKFWCPTITSGQIDAQAAQ